MKRYKLIEVVHGDVTSEPADVETWGSRNHVTRINELAADGWTIMSIVPDYGTHGEPLVYLQKDSTEKGSTDKPTIGFTETQKGEQQ